MGRVICIHERIAKNVNYRQKAASKGRWPMRRHEQLINLFLIIGYSQRPTTSVAA